MGLDMKGEVAIIMASSSGLGLGAAIALAMEGANVVINVMDKDRLESAKIKIEKVAMGEVICCQGDISERETAVKLVETAMENFGRLDHLVTNSGPPPCLRFEQSNDEDWYNAFDSLFMGIIRVIKEAEPHLKKSKNGNLVLVDRWPTMSVGKMDSAKIKVSTKSKNVTSFLSVLEQKIYNKIYSNI